MKTLQEIAALVDDRGTLLNALNDIVAVSQNDYSITRTSQIKIQEIMREALKNLKYESLHTVS